MKFIKELVPYVVIIVAVVLFRTYIATPVRVDGDSMNPTLQNGQIMILNKMDKEYKRMDIIVFDYKTDRLIKRVIGLPGETVKIEDNTIYINGEAIEDYSNDVKTADYDLEITIPSGYYFVMGDNRYDSADSRILGLISAEDIKGTICFRLYPFMQMRSF